MLVMLYKCSSCDARFAVELQRVMHDNPEGCPICEEPAYAAYAVAKVEPIEKPTA